MKWWRVYIDHQESKEFTKKRVCDKVVEDTRRSLKNVLVKKQGEWDSEPFWYFRDDAHVGELKVCSDYINHSTFSEDWDEIISDVFGDFECYGFQDSCWKSQFSWKSLNGRHNYTVFSSEGFWAGSIGVAPIWYVKFLIDWVPVDEVLDFQSFSYNEKSDRFYYTEFYPNEGFCGFHDMPQFDDEEANQKVGLVIKECRIVGE